MSGLEVNKILASIIFAVLIVTLIGHFGDLIIDTEHHDQKETAYKIDVDEDTSTESSIVKKEEIIEKNYLRNVQLAIIMKKVVQIKLVLNYGI